MSKMNLRLFSFPSSSGSTCSPCLILGAEPRIKITTLSWIYILVAILLNHDISTTFFKVHIKNIFRGSEVNNSEPEHKFCLKAEDMTAYHSLSSEQQCLRCLFAGPLTASVSGTEVSRVGTLSLPVHAHFHEWTNCCCRTSTVRLSLLQVYGVQRWL